MRISDWSSDVCSSDLLRGGAIAVVGERVDDHRHAARAVALVPHLLVIGVVTATGTLLDRPLAVVLRHVLLAGRLDRRPQRRVRCRVVAGLGGDLQLAGQPRDDLGALLTLPPFAVRSDERGIGKECRRTCRYRWAPD